MLLRGACIAALMAGTVPVSAATSPAVSQNPLGQLDDSYAILGPRFARGSVDPALKGRIVERARLALALARAPRARAHVRIEGTSSGQTRAPGAAAVAAASQDELAAARASLEDMEAMFDLALAWRLTGDKRYLKATDRYLDAWVSTYELSFNPVDEGRFGKLVLAYDLVETATPSRTRRKVDAFLRAMARGYIEAMESGNVPIKPTLTNNWQSHRIKLATLAAFQVGDRDLIDRAHRLFNAQVDANMRANGTTVDFLQRDALHYVTYSASSQLLAALAAAAHGEDWYGYKGPEGQGLARTLEWLDAFASGARQHIEFLHSVVPYDRQRAAAGGAIYQNKPWDPLTSASVYLMAGSLDARWTARARALERARMDRNTPIDPDEGPDEWLSILMKGEGR